LELLHFRVEFGLALAGGPGRRLHFGHAGAYVVELDVELVDGLLDGRCDFAREITIAGDVIVN
jgi:hypothetical protein